MTVMYDSVSVDQIPTWAEAIALYVDGKYANFEEGIKRFPKAKHLSIAVFASGDADCLDIEAGNATPSEAPAWFHRQRNRGVERPVFYCSLSVVNQLHGILTAAGIPRADYRLWTAHYTYAAHVCGPQEGITEAADATQWTDKALNRNLDQSLCSPSFFGAAPPASKWQPDDEINWTREWDRIKNRPGIAARLRRLFLRGRMLARRKAITRAAHKTGWHAENRLYRYQQLAERTG
jgi:hypothetical protein